MLEFADPTAAITDELAHPSAFRAQSQVQLQADRNRVDGLVSGGSARTYSEPLLLPRSVPSTPGAQTRLQATFDAIKKMSAGLGSPRLDFSPRKMGQATVVSASASAEARDPGYFDVETDGVEA